jgi:RNA polymerase sigma-70 factor (ECF subfamily)
MSSLSGSQFEVPESSEPINLAARREIELLRKAQQGDRASYGELVVTYQDRLYNAVLRLVGDFDEARELTQEAFTRGLMKLDSFRGDASPYTWLFRIAVNLAISHLRKVQRHRVFSLDAPPRNGNGRHDGDDQASSLADRVTRDGTSGKAAAAMPPDDLERKELHGQVLTALGRLDAEYRAVLVMRDIEGFDYQQMADVLGLPLGTLKSRLFRARLALRDELRAYLSADRPR